MVPIEIFDPKRHNRADFDCGVQELNRYLQQFANQDQKRRLAKTYVLDSWLYTQEESSQKTIVGPCDHFMPCVTTELGLWEAGTRKGFALS
jgi:hypothetical protein